MLIIRRPSLSSTRAPSAVTIGNFDGVHLGHQALFEHIADTAKAKGLIPTVLTFSPHPREFFSPTAAPQRISTLRDKLCWMKQSGVQQVMIAPFDRALSSQSPEEFVKRVLRDGINAKHVWVGDDFRFGHKRAGDYETLLQLSETYGFTVEHIASVLLDNHRISSTEVRQSLSAGHIEQAVAGLGHPLTYSGRVIHGKKLGRTLGFPTLNLRVGGKKSALSGILAVWVHGLAEQPLPGVASLGVRPTVDSDGEVLLETFVFDWQGHAYGKQVTIEVVKHLRPELKFDGLESLTVQMHEDARQARAVLAATPASPALMQKQQQQTPPIR